MLSKKWCGCPCWSDNCDLDARATITPQVCKLACSHVPFSAPDFGQVGIRVIWKKMDIGWSRKTFEGPHVKVKRCSPGMNTRQHVV